MKSYASPFLFIVLAGTVALALYLGVRSTLEFAQALPERPLSAETPALKTAPATPAPDETPVAIRGAARRSSALSS